jgi:RNA polymerase sigma-70 factor, ECF subfamily
VESKLAPLFLAGVTAGTNQTQDTDALEPLLQALLDAGRAAWPELGLGGEDFVGHLSSLWAAAAPPAEAQEFLLSVSYAEDLYLACACAHGDATALGALEQRYLSHVPSFLPARETTPARVAEVLQELRQRLLVAAPGGRPRIAAYTGRGSLMGWLRTTAVRIAVDLNRQDRGRAGHEEQERVLDALAAGPDPEVEFIKGRYRDEFKEALHDALQSLPPDQRLVMRLHYVDGVGLEQIGQMFRVHRSTVNRWVIGAREQIQKETRRLLRKRLKLSAEEYDSLAGLVRSRIEISLERGLRDAGGGRTGAGG